MNIKSVSESTATGTTGLEGVEDCDEVKEMKERIRANLGGTKRAPGTRMKGLERDVSLIAKVSARLILGGTTRAQGSGQREDKRTGRVGIIIAIIN